MISPEEIESLAVTKFGESVDSIRQINKATVRIYLHRELFIDIFQSLRDPTKFAFHAKVTGGKIYRLDCRPEKKYQKFKTFPWHFHRESENKVVVSPFSTKKRLAIVQFFKFINKEIN